MGERIPFSGSGSDQEDGTLPPAELSWSLILPHCSSANDCHEHEVVDFPGVAGGSLVAPDHEYPAHLELRLTATDSAGLQSTEGVRLDPKTVKLRFTARPTGAALIIGSARYRSPFSRTIIVGSTNSMSATSTYRWDNKTYAFHGWSDGGARTHNIVAPATDTTYRATYRPR